MTGMRKKQVTGISVLSGHGRIERKDFPRGRTQGNETPQIEEMRLQLLGVL